MGTFYIMCSNDIGFDREKKNLKCEETISLKK